MSINSTNPNSLFGGTWEQLKDRFLLASGDTYKAGNTGGEATHTPDGSVGGHTLTTSEIPSHSHTIGAHKHSIPVLSGTAASNGGHTHTVSGNTGTGYIGSFQIPVTTTDKESTANAEAQWGLPNKYTHSSGLGFTGRVAILDENFAHALIGPNGNQGSHTHTISLTSTSNGAHTHTVSTNASTTGNSSTYSSGSAGSGASHDHSFTGISQNTMPPYLVVYVWKRTA